MAEVIGASDRAALAAVEDLPVLNVADLDADPHGMFRRYRAAYPFVGHETGGYLVLRHADIQRLGIDPRTTASETAHPELFGVTDGALFDFFEQGMLTANGSVHRRRRSPFSRSFATRTMADLRPHIRRSSEELIESWYADGQVEFVRQFADQLPARVIGDLLGLPRADIPSFTKLVYLLTRFISASVLPDEILNQRRRPNSCAITWKRRSKTGVAPLVTISSRISWRRRTQPASCHLSRSYSRSCS